MFSLPVLPAMSVKNDVWISSGFHLRTTRAVYGGIMEGTPFRMRIDRPFLFLIRDYIANALLFMGVVMEAGKQIRPHPGNLQATPSPRRLIANG